jgi:hypothetical protein
VSAFSAIAPLCRDRRRIGPDLEPSFRPCLRKPSARPML